MCWWCVDIGENLQIFVKKSRARVRDAMGMTVLRVTGAEPVNETIAIFGRAAAVVGVHGAALTNAIFAPSRVCVVELSSWVDKEQRKPEEKLAKEASSQSRP